MKYNYTIILLFSLTLIACGKQTAEKPQTDTHNQLSNTVQVPDKATAAPNNTAPTTPGNTTTNNRNPFQADMNNAKNSATSPSQTINQYSISDLQMVGTITTDAQQYALIASPDGNTCTVKTGDTIGKENAIVTSISAEQVILKVTRDFNGSSYQQFVGLTLNRHSAPSFPGLNA